MAEKDEKVNEASPPDIEYVAALLADLAMTVQAAKGAKRVYLNYLLLKVIESDWHGVSDAANDMRVRGL